MRILDQGEETGYNHKMRCSDIVIEKVKEPSHNK